MARRNLGLALLDGKPDEAVEQLRVAVAIEPGNADAQQALRTALIRLGRLEDARAAWEKTLEASPTDHDAWFGYAELCLYLGKKDDYRQARTDLLARFRHATDPQIAERVSRACLLAPGTEDELRQAAALADRAVSTKPPKDDWVRPYYYFSLGLVQYRRGRYEDALATMTGDAAEVTKYFGPSARLVTAMCLFRKDRKDEARKVLAEAIASYDWSLDRANNRDAWLVHVLRREAETLIGQAGSRP